MQRSDHSALLHSHPLMLGVRRFPSIPISKGKFMEDEGTSTPDLVGTWKLISYAELDDTGTTHPWGESVVGRITYEPSGRMAVQMARSNRPRLSNSDLTSLRPDEYREAFLSYFSYFGRYTVRGGAVVHHVE